MNRPTSKPRSFSRPVTSPVAGEAGFTLVELLVVITIIALVVAITIPALGGARKQAKKADTINLCNGLSQSMSQFVLDQRRSPGYFSAKDMGSMENTNEGFSNTENVMLDLAGGIVPAFQAGDLMVGPLTTQPVIVRPSLIGTQIGTQQSSGNKAYFSPKAKYFKVQDPTDIDAGGRASTSENAQMPALVDAEGTPILVWTADETCARQTSDPVEFRSATQSPFVTTNYTANFPSKFYWASNAAFLHPNLAGVGKRRVNQAGLSLLGDGNAGYAANLGAMLGNPNSPAPFTIADPTMPVEPTDFEKIIPTAPRGQFVIQSAGADATYLIRLNKGARHGGTRILYGDNLLPAPGRDLLQDFDDIVISGN